MSPAPSKQMPRPGLPPLRETAQRYTRFVNLSKWLLWLAAGGLLVALVLTSWSNTGDSGTRIVFSSAQQADTAEPSVMKKPVYHGTDAKNQPFTVIADSATQENDDRIVLNKLQADMTLENAKWAALSANSGVLKPESKKLELAGAVEMFYDGGYNVRTPYALVDTAAGTIDGSKPVEGQGPSGTLKAKRFKVLERGRVLRFEGDVEVTLYLEQK